MELIIYYSSRRVSLPIEYVCSRSLFKRFHDMSVSKNTFRSEYEGQNSVTLVAFVVHMVRRSK